MRDSPPDVSYQTDWVVNFAKQGKLQDLSSNITKEKQGGYSPGAIQYGTIDGKLIGVPFIALDTMVFYNKTIFKEKNIEIPQTCDEYITAAKKATYSGDHYGIGFATHPMDYWQPLSFIYQAGASLYNADMTKANFNNTEGIKGLQFFSDLYNKYKVVPPVDCLVSVVYSGIYCIPFCQGKIYRRNDSRSNERIKKNRGDCYEKHNRSRKT